MNVENRDFAGEVWRLALGSPHFACDVRRPSRAVSSFIVEVARIVVQVWSSARAVRRTDVESLDFAVESWHFVVESLDFVVESPRFALLRRRTTIAVADFGVYPPACAR
jgi:hypothetical protein